LDFKTFERVLKEGTTCGTTKREKGNGKLRRKVGGEGLNN